MQYVSVAEARQMQGLRLVLSAHVPGPWGESAKAVFRARNIAFTPVEQTPLGANEELCAWTGGIRNAPIAMLDGDPPVQGWLDIVMLAEQIGSGPSLLPTRSLDRALALGLSAELCAREGFGWARRLTMFSGRYDESHLGPDAPPHVRSMLQQYGFSLEAIRQANRRLIDILSTLAAQLERQRASGSAYMVGESLSTIDLHWACFSQMIAPLPVADQPAITPALFDRYADVDPSVTAALAPSLLEHRDFIFRRHIGLPLDY